MQKTIEKNLSISHTNASELVALNCLCEEGNTCHRQSMCYKRVLRISMLLRGTLSNSITFTVINEYGKGGAIEIQTVFWPVYHVACQGFFYNGTF